MNIDTQKLVPEFESSYEEDGKIYILASSKPISKDAATYIIPRWDIAVDPATRKIDEINFFLSLDEGFEYPSYTPTKEQLSLFDQWAKDEGHKLA